MKKGLLTPLLAGAAILLAAGTVTWLNLSSGRTAAASSRTAAQARVQSHPVESETVRRGTLESAVKLACEVEAETEVEVFPDVAGRVAEISVGVGSSVAAGSVLATIDPSRPGTRYEASPVRSPIAGTVVDIFARPGQVVSTSTATFTVATTGSLVVKARVPERYASAVTRGSVARVSFENPVTASFEARVASLPPVIDAVSRSKEVAFAVPPGVKGIEPGMFGTIEIIARRAVGAVLVPFESIIQEGERNYVFIVERDRAVKREVSLGLLSGSLVEITQGLTGGEEAVTSGQSFLKDGSPVTVVSR